MSEPNQKPAGIKEVAAALGISIGTVDRALHDRPGVSAKTRSRVLALADELNYRPNLSARNLKLNRRIHLAVCLPEEIASFFDPLRAGIRAAAAAAHGINVELDFHSFPRLGEGDLRVLKSDLGRHYNGMILTPGPGNIGPLLRQLQQRGTAVVCVASDVPSETRLASISVDATVSGGIAAELLARTLRKPGRVAVVTGDLRTQDHAEKVRGFAATLAVIAPQLSLLPTIESHESPRQAYQATLKLLSQRPRPSGIYINTANSSPVLRALQESNLLGEIQVVATDLFPEIASLIQNGSLLASLHQRPFAQGKIAFEVLVRYLLSGAKPEQVTRLAPHIILRSNLSLFINKLGGVEDSESPNL